MGPQKTMQSVGRLRRAHDLTLCRSNLETRAAGLKSVRDRAKAQTRKHWTPVVNNSISRSMRIRFSVRTGAIMASFRPTWRAATTVSAGTRIRKYTASTVAAIGLSANPTKTNSASESVAPAFERPQALAATVSISTTHNGLASLLTTTQVEAGMCPGFRYFSR